MYIKVTMIYLQREVNIIEGIVYFVYQQYEHNYL